MTFHPVNSPAHYIEGRQFQPIDVLEEFFGLDPLLWQVGKYLSRYGRKSKGSSDLEKALYYLTRFRTQYTVPSAMLSTHSTISAVISDWFADPNANVALAMEYLLEAVSWRSKTASDDCLRLVEFYLKQEILELSQKTILDTVDTSSHIGESVSSFEDESSSAFTFDQYQVAAARTIVFPDAAKLYYPALGLCGEAGEVAEKVKKLFRDHGGVITEDFRKSVTKELGDVLWYITALCRDLGISLQSVAETNLEKLADRHKRNVIRGNGDDR